MIAIVLGTSFVTQALAQSLSENAQTSVINIRTAGKSGSGFVISKDGYILTNDHVVSGTSQVQICRQPDIKRDPICDLEATVIVQDSELDIALLKIDDVARGKVFPFLPLGYSDSLALDETVRLLGFPDSGGSSLTVTSGRISGYIDNGSRIKVDASLSSGSSGGAMIDANETVVGVNVAVLTGNFASSGLAIPIDLVKTWLIGAGYGKLVSLGQTVEELETSKAALEDLLQNYQQLAKAQKIDYEDITSKYDQQREDQDEQMEGVRDSAQKKQRDYRNQIDSYLEDVRQQYSEATYQSEVSRLDAVWEDYLRRSEESVAEAEKTYEANLKIIDRNEAIALENAGVVDYTPRIAEAHAALEEVKRELSRLRIAEAKKKVGRDETSNNAASGTDATDKEQQPVDSDAETSVTYEDFGSPRAVTLAEDWSIKSITFERNNRHFAFVFYKSLLPDVLRNTFRFEATITEAESGEELRPLFVRKRLMMLMYEPGTDYLLELRAVDRDDTAVDELTLKITP